MPDCTTTQPVARKIAKPEDLIVIRDVADLGCAQSAEFLQGREKPYGLVTLWGNFSDFVCISPIHKIAIAQSMPYFAASTCQVLKTQHLFLSLFYNFQHNYRIE